MLIPIWNYCFFLLTTLLCLTIKEVCAYKILVIATSPTRSHYILGKGIADVLHTKGHKITFIHSQDNKNLPYREIALSGIGKMLEDNFPINTSPRSVLQPYKTIFMNHYYFMNMMFEPVLIHEKMATFMADKNEKFDLVIVDYLMNDIFAAFGIKYDCPVIMISTVSMLHWLARNSGNPIAPETVANVYTDCSPEMGFIDRIKNTAMAVLSDIIEFTINDVSEEAAYIKYFPEEASKMPYSAAKRRISLVFSNTHPSVVPVRPVLPNVVEIGGYHIGKIDPLPVDLKTVMDNSKNGVIFFSMGTVLNTSSLPENTVKDIFKSFSKLKQTIIWKYDTDLPGKPNNVVIKKWAPQPGILAHPNTKAFISHSGLLSLTEATAFAVPIISVPAFGDQFYNGNVIKYKKTGLLLHLSNITENSLDWALNEILNNPMYKENALNYQKLYKDRPISQDQLINFYAEHVIRTGGAEHLSGPTLNIFSFMLLDVIAVLLILPILMLTVIVWICKTMCCSKKMNKSDLEKKIK